MFDAAELQLLLARALAQARVGATAHGPLLCAPEANFKLQGRTPGGARGQQAGFAAPQSFLVPCHQHTCQQCSQFLYVLPHARIARLSHQALCADWPLPLAHWLYPASRSRPCRRP